jgi:hypothetical protein
MALVTMPTAPPAPKSVEWALGNTVASTLSPFSLQRQKFDWQASVLRASLSYAPIPKSQALAWFAFLASCRGLANTFLFGDPVYSGPQNPAAVGGSVSGSGQTGYTLTTSSSGLTPGDWIMIPNRLYLVTSVAGGTLGIWPQIRESPPSGTAIILANPRGTFRLAGNEQKITVREGQMYALTFEIEEDI